MFAVGHQFLKLATAVRRCSACIRDQVCPPKLCANRYPVPAITTHFPVGAHLLPNKKSVASGGRQCSLCCHSRQTDGALDTHWVPTSHANLPRSGPLHASSWYSSPPLPPTPHILLLFSPALLSPSCFSTNHVAYTFCRPALAVLACPVAAPQSPANIAASVFPFSSHLSILASRPLEHLHNLPFLRTATASFASGHDTHTDRIHSLTLFDDVL